MLHLILRFIWDTLLNKPLAAKLYEDDSLTDSKVQRTVFFAPSIPLDDNGFPIGVIDEESSHTDDTRVIFRYRSAKRPP
jgi:hypothetical protein